MKIRIFHYVACLILVLCLSAPCMAASVAQGKCITYDKAKHTITIEEYDINITKDTPYGKTTGKTTEFQVVTGTLVGREPEPGNILRVSYKEVDGQKQLLKVQNVTKQDLMKR